MSADCPSCRQRVTEPRVQVAASARGVFLNRLCPNCGELLDNRRLSRPGDPPPATEAPAPRTEPHHQATV